MQIDGRFQESDGRIWLLGERM